MTQEEFKTFVMSNPKIYEALQSAIPKQHFGGVSETVLILMMFPIVHFILTQIGLPWLHEAKHYSELWRQKLHRWIDNQYQKHGFDPDKAEESSEKLRKELETITDVSVKKIWENLSELLKKR